MCFYVYLLSSCGLLWLESSEFCSDIPIIKWSDFLLVQQTDNIKLDIGLLYILPSGQMHYSANVQGNKHILATKVLMPVEGRGGPGICTT